MYACEGCRASGDESKVVCVCALIAGLAAVLARFQGVFSRVFRGRVKVLESDQAVCDGKYKDYAGFKTE